MSDHLPGGQRLLDALLIKKNINAEQYTQAKKLIGLTPERDDWRRFLDSILLFLGATLLGLGVIFFFAYNWQDLHKFHKFAILAGGMLLCVLLAHIKGVHTHAGKGALILSCLLAGTLLAVYGQTYQTGADPYSLFLGWAIFILGWVWIARLQALWILFIFLLNLALIMYWSEFISERSRFSFFFRSNPLLLRLTGMNDGGLQMLLILLNGAGLAVWEWAMKTKSPGFSSRWAVRLLATYSLIIATQLWLHMLFSYREEKSGQALEAFTYIAVVTAMIWYYRKFGKDLYMLAICYFSLVVTICATIGKGIHDETSAFFVISLAALGLSSAFAASLKNIAKQWREQHEQQ